jgi:capsular exopolysaccharide synthesis family protein
VQQVSVPQLAADYIDLRQLLHTLQRHKWGIIVLPILVMMLTYLTLLSVTPIYRAVATMLIEPSTANVVSIEEVYGLGGSNREYLQTQFELLKSRSLAEEVVRELNLVEHPEFDPRQQEAPLLDWRALLDVRSLARTLGLDGVLPLTRPEDLRGPSDPEADRFEEVVESLRQRVTVSPERLTQLVSIAVEMADPRTAASAANALANGYIEQQLAARMDMTRTATDWMTKRLSDLKDKLRDSERRLQEYRERENLVDIEGVTTVSAEGLTQLGSNLVEARQALAVAENQYRQIQEVADANWRRQATVAVVLGNELVAEFRAEETRARAKVDELSKRYGPKHPVMIQARSELNAAAESLRSQVEQVVASIERNYQLAQANLSSIEGSFEQNKDEMQEVQRKEFTFRELMREVETNRSLYDTFMTRLKETSATSDLEAVNARVVDRAIVPNEPAKPRKGLITLVAGMLALMAAIALAFLREALDNRVHGAGDVEEKLQLPVLGLLPLQKKQTDRQRIARLYMEDTDKAFSESVRTIRTGVVLSGLDNPHKIIVITSALPGEGKTSVATNLAMALGQMEKVLLLEADMRRPAFARSFDIPAGTPGLANVTAGAASLAEAIQRIEDIDVLACGTVPPNPLELLSSARFKQLLDELDASYDRIVIDAPPVQAVSDPLVLSTHANAVLFVVKTEATPVPLIRKGISQLQSSGAPLTGIVLQQVDVKKSKKYGYGEGGRYGYGYAGYYDYYGYSSGTKSKA